MKSEQALDAALLKEREKESNKIAVEQALQLEREKEAQEKATEALALKKKEEATWSYQLYNYYQVAQHSIIYWSNSLGLTYIGEQIALQVTLVPSYLYHFMIASGNVIHSWMKDIMLYFQKHPDVKKQPLETHVENIATVVEPVTHAESVEHNEAFAPIHQDEHHVEVAMPQVASDKAQV